MLTAMSSAMIYGLLPVFMVRVLNISIASVGIIAVARPGTFSASLVGTAAVVGVVVFGVITTLFVSWILSRTILRGEPSAFILELPPYRRPSFLRVLYTSLIDRTAFVLYRAASSPCQPAASYGSWPI